MILMYTVPTLLADANPRICRPSPNAGDSVLCRAKLRIECNLGIVNNYLELLVTVKNDNVFLYY
jgi:hypothetical protein